MAKISKRTWLEMVFGTVLLVIGKLFPEIIEIIKNIIK